MPFVDLAIVIVALTTAGFLGLAAIVTGSFELPRRLWVQSVICGLFFGLVLTAGIWLDA